jgi:hypothetical protein
MISRKYTALSLSGIAALVLACGDSGETGQVRLHAGDAPFPFELIDSATVVVEKVDIHIAADEAGESGFHVLTTAQHTLNLLELQNGVTTVLADSEVPAGKITEIRLEVSEASVTLTDGRTFDLNIPSGDESGLKIFPNPHIEVVGSLTTELLLDFDVSRSFHPIPSGATQAVEIEGFTFRPSLRASNLSETGTLSGTVWSDAGTPGNVGDDLPLENAAVTVQQGGQEVTASSTSAGGHYKLLGLPTGPALLVATANGFAADSLSATVVAGNESGGHDFRLTPSAAPGL